MPPRAQVFRCVEPGKGWGVRCVDPIPAGSFICDYVGEVRRGSTGAIGARPLLLTRVWHGVLWRGDA